ncbi:MAG: AAA family ATPase [Syntrophobacteraceae bacterium]|nr:AAA family ATPase [Syntrophobacteraceae bacterium]
MLPIELDHELERDAPFSEHGSLNLAFQAIQAILGHNILSYFRNDRGVSLSQLVELRRSIVFRRLADEANRIALPSLLLRQQQGWSILIHERLIDPLAHILSARPDYPAPLAGGEERKILKFCEFFLRHHFEHLAFPDASELEVISSDIDFALARTKRDPQAFGALLEMFENPQWGALGKNYAELLQRAKRNEECGFRTLRVAAAYAGQVAELPTGLLVELFADLDLQMQSRVLDKIYRKSLLPGQAVSKSTSELMKILRLFGAAVLHDSSEAFKLFTIFDEHRGVGSLFEELDISTLLAPGKSLAELFEIFKKNLEELVRPGETFNRQGTWKAAPQTGSASPQQQARSLKERIDEARTDPDVPHSVIEVIEKNRMNATGQSGAKYTELIETLLAIPWGRIKKIWISPEEFDEGLNRSHYGLEKPKEIISDLFANLIWRYQHFKESERKSWRRTGTALLFAGPPGVGKTSLAISIARNLGIPYHKISLGGMKDEADIRGYGFTYEGSKPGLIVQGLIKMGVMNGMFIMDEADKTEKFAIATLLEILDPEQNHLFHDKYTQSTVDIDLSNCHFILTANTVETVPEAVLNRCEVIFLDRYSVDEKIAIAREFLIERIRERYMIGRDEIVLDPEEETEILRSLIRDYTSEAGVRDLERIMRTLFLRTQRKEIMVKGRTSVKLDMARIGKYLDAPNRQRSINEDDRIGEMMALGVNLEMGVGGLIPIQVTPVRVGLDRKNGGQSYLSMVHTTGNIERVMDESRKVASTAILHLSEELGIDSADTSIPVHLHFMGGSTRKDGPSAGAAIALALSSLFSMRKIRRDVAVTGEIDTQGRVTGIGGMAVKLETAYAAGCRTLIIPKENLTGNEGLDRLPEALKKELQILTFEQWETSHEPFDYSRHMLQVVAVDDIAQAAKVAFIEQEEIDSLDRSFQEHAEKALADSASPGLRTLRVVFVDNFGAASPELPGAHLCADNHECIILVRPDFREEIPQKIGEAAGKWVIREFNPGKERLVDVLRDIKSEYKFSARPFRISLVAPLVFLRREGLRPEELKRDAVFQGLRIFADSCTAGNVPVRDCSITLARSLSRVVDLSDGLLESCPFLSRSEGIYAPTVAFIPEKYRIDVRRAQEILDRCLSKWLSMAGGSAEDETLAVKGGLGP